MAVVPPDLAALSGEAVSLLEQAKQLRARMNDLSADDPQRAELEQVIRNLLKSANSISDAVKSSVSRL